MTSKRLWLGIVGCTLTLACTHRVSEPGSAEPIPSGASEAGSGAPADAAAKATEALHEGTRLRPRFRVEKGASDGAPGQFVGWHDDELDIDCVFTKDVDDRYRCLPLEDSGLDVYPDATCTSDTHVTALLAPIGEPRPDCTPRYAKNLYEGTRCHDASEGRLVHITGPAMATDATRPYVETYFGDCNRRGTISSNPAPDPCLPEEGCDPTASDPAAFDPGPQWVYCEYDPVESVTFVTAETEIRPVGAVRQLVLRGEDGSVEPHSLLHPDFDTVVFRDSWGGATLVPDAIETSGPWPETAADGACTKPTFCSPDTPPSCARLVVQQPDDCSAHVYELGAPVDETHWCSGDALQDPSLFCFERVREVASLPYDEVALGSDRLRPIWITEAGAPVQPTNYFHDAMLDTTCGAETTSDGTTRCVPDNPALGTLFPTPGVDIGWVSLFADAECTQPLGFTYVPLCAESAPTFRLDFGERQRMRSTGEPPTTDLHAGFVIPGGDVVLECHPFAGRPTELFEAETLDDDAFAEMKQVTR